MYWEIKKVSEYLNIKPATLYAWAAQGKIPSIKIHGLIRFKKEEIDLWLESFKKSGQNAPSIRFSGKDQKSIDAIIENAKREVYNSDRGETRPKSAQREEKENGAV